MKLARKSQEGKVPSRNSDTDNSASSVNLTELDEDQLNNVVGGSDEPETAPDVPLPDDITDSIGSGKKAALDFFE